MSWHLIAHGSDGDGSDLDGFARPRPVHRQNPDADRVWDKPFQISGWPRRKPARKSEPVLVCMPLKKGGDTVTISHFEKHVGNGVIRRRCAVRVQAGVA